ncbi:MAG: hypothetical protein ACKVP3_16220 [Hyphomicrobiaceae bacterium]
MASCDKGTSTASRLRARQLARPVSLLSAVAILGLWAAAWAPISQISHADAEIGLSDVAIKVPDLQGVKGNGIRNGAHLSNAPARVAQLTAEKVRLEAERDAATELHFPSGFARSDRGAAAAAARERRLFETRRAAVRRQKALLGQRIVQVRHEVAGLLMQQRAREKEVQLFRDELRLIDDMHGRKLVNVARLMGLRRDLARSEGEVGGLAAQVARARAQIEEIEMQILEAEQKPVLEAQKEIRDVDARIDELSGRGSL